MGPSSLPSLILLPISSAHHFLLDIDHGRILYPVLLLPFSHILALHGLRIKFPRLSFSLSPKPPLPLSRTERLSLDGVRPNLSCPQGQVPWAPPCTLTCFFECSSLPSGMTFSSLLCPPTLQCSLGIKSLLIIQLHQNSDLQRKHEYI